jgi:hypothetical protein
MRYEGSLVPTPHAGAFVPGGQALVDGTVRGSSSRLLVKFHLERYELYAHISDIVDGFVLHDAWAGKCVVDYHKSSSWPSQGPPSRADWELWQKALRKYILGRGLHLKYSLGAWIKPSDTWPWYYDPPSRSLFYKKDSQFFSFRPAIQHGSRPCFYNEKTPTIAPVGLQRATIYRKGNLLVFNGYAPVYQNPSTGRSSFLEYLRSVSPDSAKWCLCHLTLPDDNELYLADAIRNRSVVAVTNGAYKDTVGTAGWILESKDGARLSQLCHYFNVVDGKIHLA